MEKKNFLNIDNLTSLFFDNEYYLNQMNFVINKKLLFVLAYYSTLGQIFLIEIHYKILALTSGDLARISRIYLF